MPEDDQRATQKLFIGHLDHSVSEVKLRRAFEKYGIIEEVVIKRPARGQGGACREKGPVKETHPEQSQRNTLWPCNQNQRNVP